ncbi:hypothetical protein SAMN05877753_105373 [Bacillus oleivorans]|uniref:Uncharacterized protein n=1 Tax=Bacillus oleivorans TaxID=1448271 RepID=A0A285CW40_9BACI|nr:hypothetical protein [Bacillus oleivorans]SNX71780.1 hypothetical protein SAMN05877753_105373 [Bacillus oleivorans]
MTIETQLEVIKKALEMGADVEIKFHSMDNYGKRSRENAQKTFVELGSPLGLVPVEWETEKHAGFRSEQYGPVSISTYYDKKEESKQNEITHDVAVR